MGSQAHSQREFRKRALDRRGIPAVHETATNVSCSYVSGTLTVNPRLSTGRLIHAKNMKFFVGVLFVGVGLIQEGGLF